MKRCLSILTNALLVLTPVIIGVVSFVAFQSYEDLGYSGENELSTPAQTPLLTPEQLELYQQDGFILVKGLVSGDQLALLRETTQAVVANYFWTDMLFAKYYGTVRMQGWKIKKNIAQFALQSNLGAMAAQLLSEQQSIRILKDAIFQQVAGGEGCGFHVDDDGFWPSNSGGATFWIALSEMRKDEGGGIRLAKGSHHETEFVLECRQAIKNGTCGIAEFSPSCNEALLGMSVTHDMEPGDAIIWDRYLFHKGDPFKDAKSTAKKLRYSVRYVPSGATARGMHHKSVETGGILEGPHYPQVWPKLLSHEVEGFGSFGSSLKSRFLPFA